MAGIGLSRVLQGTVEGIDKGLARRDRNTQRERADTQYNQQQEDRSYKLKRQKTTDSRADEQYDREKGFQNQEDDIRQVLRDGLSTGWQNLDQVAQTYKKYTGADVNFSVGADGKRYVTMSKDGKTSDLTPAEDDDIGFALHSLLPSQSPGEELKYRRGKKDAAEAQGAKNKFTLKRDRIKQSNAIALEKIKQGLKGSKSTKEYRKQLAIASKQNRKIAVENNGKLFDGLFSFDDDQKVVLANWGGALADAEYIASDDPNITTATTGNMAYMKMREFRDAAVKQADTDKEQYGLDEDQYKNRVIELIDDQAGNYIKDLSKAPKPEISLGRNKKEAVSKEKFTSKDGNTIPLGATQRLKQDKDDPAALKEFDEYFKTPGLAKKILGGKGKIANPDNKSPAGVSDNSDNSLVRDAGAAGQKKPAKKGKYAGLSRSEKRQQIEKSKGGRNKKRQSLKATRETVKSEYRDKWKSMSDQEKIDWFNDNRALLKDTSPSGYRKAYKDVRKINSNKRFSKEGKKAYQLQRGNK